MNKYPIQDDSQKWDVAFARRSFRYHELDALGEGHEKAIKSNLAQILAVHLVELLNVTREDKGEEVIFQVALPVGPWHFVTRKEHEALEQLNKELDFLKNVSEVSHYDGGPI